MLALTIDVRHDARMTHANDASIYLWKIDQGRASFVSKIWYWSVMSANHDVGLSSIQWRASSRQGRFTLR